MANTNHKQKKTKRIIGNSISEGMKRYHAERKNAMVEAENLRKALAEKTLSISSIRDVSRYTYKNLNPATIAYVLDSTRGGYLKQWSDFCDIILEDDARIHGLIEARIRSVTGKKLVIEPADKSVEAVEASDFIRSILDHIPDFQQFLFRTSMAIFKGVSAHEIIYDYDSLEDVYKVKELSPIQMSKLKIILNPVNSKGEQIITDTETGYGEYVYSYYDQGGTGQANGVNLQLTFPGKFIIHSPGNEELLHYRGLFRTIAWTWFFKKIGKSFWLAGSEKYAFPVLYAKVPQGTQAETIQYLADNLNNLANDASGVFDESVTIDTINPGATGGDAVWRQLISELNDEIAILIMGGTLTSDQSSAGGSNALGEVHQNNFFSLLKSDAQSLSETIRNQLVIPILELNAHRFGNKIPPVPSVFFDVQPKLPASIEEWHIRAGVITTNELRESINLPEWSKEQGGHDIVKLIEETVPDTMFSISNGSNFDNASTFYKNKEEEDIALKKELEDPQSIAEFDDSAVVIPEE